MGDLMPYQTPRRYNREIEAVQYRVNLEAAIQALRLSNAYKLTQMQISLHVQLGEDIARRLETTDNPVVQLALKRAFEQWLVKSDQIVAGY